MYLHWQNLHEREDGSKHGLILTHGRAWLHLADRLSIRWEWKIPYVYPHLSFSKDHDESELKVSISPIVCGFWVTLEAWRWRRWLFTGRGERELDLSWSDGRLHWSLWMPAWESHSTDPKWRRGYFDPMDTLFGRMKYETADVSTTPGEIVLPEATYPVLVRIFDSTWMRPRWPRWPLTRFIRRAEVEVLSENGIPEPPKGESAWDLDERSSYSMTT